METKNYKFELMHQGQEHKDIVYNESILKLDANLNLTILNFTAVAPEHISYGDRFIITAEGDNQNKICYFAHPDKGVEYLSPHNNMFVFMVKDNCFARFHENKWHKINFAPEIEAQADRFSGVRDEFIVPGAKDVHYLFLENRVRFNFAQAKESFTLIIKQNHQAIYQVTWPDNVLWPNRVVTQITATTNSIDILRFYKLPETGHFIAEIVHQDYRY